jgi:SAM-dependent methyltransferase
MGAAGKYNLLEMRHIEDDRQLRDAYECRYDSEPIRHLDSFYRWILKLVRPQPGRRLLDVACGQGVIPDIAARQGVEAHGFDLSMRAVHPAGGVRAALIVADGEHIPYADRSFDYVTNIGSLEHYADPSRGAHEMARVLARGGRAFVLLPNTFGFGNILHAWRYGRTLDDGQPIQRYAARFEWQALLEDSGLRTLITVPYERVWPSVLRDVFWYLRNPKALVLLLATALLPLNLASCFVYVCRRVDDAE